MPLIVKLVKKKLKFKQRPLTCHFFPFLETPRYFEPRSVNIVCFLGFDVIKRSLLLLHSDKIRLSS